MSNQRFAGILLHPTSLPGDNGIGEIGHEALHFVDWLVSAGQSIWQVLPLGPTGFGDSPYQCFSAFAGNPYIISLDLLVENGLLDEDQLVPLRSLQQERVPYGDVIPLKLSLLKNAFVKWQEAAATKEQKEFQAFCTEEAEWLDDYSLFMALKEFHNGQSWYTWPELDRDRHEKAMATARKGLAEAIQWQQWMQFIFFRQWRTVKAYANRSGIQIMGDMPIFVAYDSAEAWADRAMFKFDNKGVPSVVAGVPPDYFSATGQRWGNPLYHWPNHEKDEFGWWEKRILTALKMYDLIRIDHFRGFVACYEIPGTAPTAEKGTWKKAPGKKLFTALKKKHGDLPLIAEDLGVIDDEVIGLRKKFGFPGMCILQFAWGSGSDNVFLPHNHERDHVVYSGTHDNNTTVGWWHEETTQAIMDHLGTSVGHFIETPHEDFIRLAYGSVADYAIIPMQDVLGLDASARMNRPGNAEGNWSWRVTQDQLNGLAASQMRRYADLFNRLPERESKED